MTFRSVLLLFLLASLILPVTLADEGTIGKALKKGSVDIGFRYRFENVADDGASFMGRDGNASTLRTTLRYRSARYQGFDVLLEVEDVTDLGLDDDHDNAGAGSLNNGVDNRPVIADPEITEIQQIALGYQLDDIVGVSAGRREINLREQRYVGAVGWRQHHQSFDAVQVDVEAIPRTELTYIYLDRVHRIFGDDKPMGSHALSAVIDVIADNTLELYGYELDYDRMVDAGLSTQTFGARWKGEAAIGDDWTLPYHLEWATQSDTGDNTADIDADYMRLQLDARCKRGWLRAGYEMLGGDTTDGSFSTPLATLHKWNGWADRFLNTPPDGLEDLYLGVGGSTGAWKGLIVYHQFDADSNGMDYGSEIDAQISWKAHWDQTFALKYASYNADELSVDVDKIWLYTSYAFDVK